MPKIAQKSWWKRTFGSSKNSEKGSPEEQLHAKLPQLCQLYTQRGAYGLLLSRQFEFLESGVAGEKIVMTLPFAEDETLAKFYSCFGKERMHLGLLVEDFDVLAADIAYNYANSGRDPNIPHLNVVTVFAEGFTFQTVDKSLMLNILTRNLTVECEITHVSDSAKSMEVTIRSMTHDDDRRIPIGDMRLVMVPVNSETNKVEAGRLLDKSEVNDFEKFERGATRYIQRKNIRKQNRKPVSEREREEIESFVGDYKNTVRIIDTQTITHDTMYVQNVNYYGKMFGGYLMRKMIELGTTCVRKFVGAQSFQEIPMVLGISDVSFLQSVNVGDVSIIDARVYLCNPKTGSIVVSVTIEDAFGKKLTNGFNLIFQNILEKELSCVIPESDEELHHVVEIIRTLSVVFPVLNFESF